MPGLTIVANLSSDEYFTIYNAFLNYLVLNNKTNDLLQSNNSNEIDPLKVKDHLYEIVALRGLPKVINYENFSDIPRSYEDPGFNDDQHCKYDKLNLEEEEFVETWRWILLDVVCNILVIVGSLSNLIAIIVYYSSRSKFNTVFYCILKQLLAMKTCHLVSNFSLWCIKGSPDMPLQYLWILLYPLPSLFILSSTFLTTVLAYHRYQGLNDPVRYFMTWRNRDPRRSSFHIFGGCVLASFALVFPLAFEPELRSHSFVDEQWIQNSSRILLTKHSQSWLDVSDFRRNPYYIVFYRNVIQFLVSIFTPCSLTAYWNIKTAISINKRNSNNVQNFNLVGIVQVEHQVERNQTVTQQDGKTCFSDSSLSSIQQKSNTKSRLMRHSSWKTKEIILNGELRHLSLEHLDKYKEKPFMSSTPDMNISGNKLDNLVSKEEKQTLQEHRFLEIKIVSRNENQDHPDSSVPGDGDKIDDLNSDNNNVQEENPNATGKGCWHWARKRLKSIVEDDKKLTQARIDHHQTHVLYIVVAIFWLACLPRAALNVIEVHLFQDWFFSSSETSTDVVCLNMPAWFIILTFVSSVLMSFNSCVGLPIYCLMCKNFREEFYNTLVWIWATMTSPFKK